VGDAWEEISTLQDLAFICLNCGDFLAAQEPIEHSQRIIQKIGGPYNQGFTLMHRCEAAYQKGELTRAQEYGRQALAIFHQIKAPRPEAFILAMLGRIVYTMGNLSEAQEFLEMSLAITRNSLSEIDVADVLVRLGLALANQGRWAQAEVAYQQAIDLITASDKSGFDQDTQANAWVGLAQSALAQGRLAESSKYISGVIDYLNTNPDYQNVYGTVGTTYSYWNVIQVLQALNDPRASEVLETAYHLVHDQAARIPTEGERRMYLENLPWNREIVALWESSGTGLPSVPSNVIG
jgi:tetratricopeptide (TPR) repeat protein